MFTIASDPAYCGRLSRPTTITNPKDEGKGLMLPTNDDSVESGDQNVFNIDT